MTTTDISTEAAAADLERNDPAEELYRQERRAHWDEVARRWERRSGLAGAYHRRLERVYRFLVPPGLKVLELGCGRGDLLAALKPAVGLGIDLSGEMIRQAAARHPDLRFLEADAHVLEGLDETFDVIILSDLINDAWDVQRLLRRIAPLTHRRTRVILNVYSRLWELPLALAQRLGLARPVLYQNWLTVAGRQEPPPSRRLPDHPPLAGGAAAARHPPARAFLQPFPRPPLAVPASRPHQLPRGPAGPPAFGERAGRLRDRAGQKRRGEHPRHLRPHARDGGRHRARLRRRAFERRHLGRHRTRDRGPIPSADRKPSSRPARARGTPSASGSPRRAATS